MTNFKRYKMDGDLWTSPPFYTHPKGYKLCVFVQANGYDVHIPQLEFI